MLFQEHYQAQSYQLTSTPHDLQNTFGRFLMQAFHLLLQVSEGKGLEKQHQIQTPWCSESVNQASPPHIIALNSCRCFSWSKDDQHVNQQALKTGVTSGTSEPLEKEYIK